MDRPSFFTHDDLKRAMFALNAALSPEVGEEVYGREVDRRFGSRSV